MLTKSFLNRIIYSFGGKYWFKLKVTNWRLGTSVRLFKWSKQVAIFKKKQLLKKKK